MGKSGALATDMYVKLNWLPANLTAQKPDIIVMHLGTNDVVQRKPTADIIAAYNTLVDQMRDYKDDIDIIVSTSVIQVYTPVRPLSLSTARLRHYVRQRLLGLPLKLASSGGALTLAFPSSNNYPPRGFTEHCDTPLTSHYHRLPISPKPPGALPISLILPSSSLILSTHTPS